MGQNKVHLLTYRTNALHLPWAFVLFLLQGPASAGEIPECMPSSGLPSTEVVYQPTPIAETLPRFELGIVHPETHRVLPFPEGTFEDSITGWDTERLPDEDSALIQTKVTRSGDRALQISIGPEDRKIMGSWRSEVKDPYRVGMNQPAWHRFSILIPQDYAIEKADAFVFAQWHQLKQPGDDRRRSPPCLFVFGMDAWTLLVKRRQRIAQSRANKHCFTVRKISLSGSGTTSKCMPCGPQSRKDRLRFG